MRYFLLFLVTISVNLNAADDKQSVGEDPNMPINEPNTGTQAGTFPCPTSEQPSVAQLGDPNKLRPDQKGNEKDGTAQFKPVETSETVMVAASNDPFGAPCSYR